ncbi:MAG: ROK family protein [Bacteroidota bacterium]
MIPLQGDVPHTMDSERLGVGVDIGGTNTAIGVMTDSGRIVAETRFSTRGFGGPGGFVDKLAASIAQLLHESTHAAIIHSIGIACPAVNSREGIVDNPANLGWGKVDLVGMLRHHFDYPIHLLNDGDAAVLGEVRFGVARGLSNVVLITLGTGLGAGIVIDGKLVRGTNGIGGEIGHILVAPGDRVCGCGRSGCVETYVSATGICRTATELMGRSIDPSPLRQIAYAELTARTISTLAQQGDPLSRMAYEVTGKHLGNLLANLTAIFDPEAMVLYGGLIHAGDLLVKPALKAFRESVLDRYKNTVRILISQLNDGQASILGAGSFALGALPEGSTVARGQAYKANPETSEIPR